MGNCKCGNCEKDEELEKILEVYKQDKDNLIQILNEVQEHYGYIPTSAQMRVAEYLNIPLAEVYGVVTFYSRFTLKPKEKYNIAVCLGTACYVKGSEKILERVKERLKIDVGETTPDRKVFNRGNKMYRSLWLSPCIYNKSERYMVRQPYKNLIRF